MAHPKTAKMLTVLGHMAARFLHPTHWPSMKPNSFLSRTFLLAAITLSSSAGAQNGPQMHLQRVELAAGMHRIEAQLAASAQERQIGLMFRREMPQHEGMLFVFEQSATQCFWMKNTPLALTAAFVADDGTIVNLADMQPMTEDSHCSARPVRFVLEMNQGWFAKKGLKAGSKLTGRPFQPARP